MQEKMNYKYILCSEPTLHKVMSLHFAPHLSYSFYYLIKQTPKTKMKQNNRIYYWTWQILTAIVFHSTRFSYSLVHKLYFEFYDQLE